MSTVKVTPKFKGWMKGLDDEPRAIVAERVERLRNGLTGDSKFLEDKVSELRIHVGPGYRLYYTKRGQTIYILLCGGTKRTQKKDLKTAKGMAKEI